MKRRHIMLYSILAGLAALHACQSEQELDYARYYTNGKQLYAQHCQNCHGTGGEGLGKLIPPLTDSLFLKQNRNALPCIIKNGLSQPVSINGKIFNEQMPANKQLADIEIAELVTYITNSFGNKQGLYKSQAAASDLSNCK